MKTSIWNSATTAKLTGLWQAGYSAARIADQLGCTRNMAAAKVKRLKLAPHEAIFTKDGQTYKAQRPRAVMKPPKAAPKEPKTKSQLLAMLQEAVRNTINQ